MTKLENLTIISVGKLYRRCLGAFAVGLFLGAYVIYITFASGPNTISKALIEVGEHLCQQWDGLAEIGRVGPSHYAFRCRSLAVFPQVEVTIEKEQ